MKRIMVLMGLGSWMLLVSSAPCSAEFPVSFAHESNTSITSHAATPPTVKWHTDLRSGWRDSKRLGIPMVIFITMDNCTYCDAMKQTTWNSYAVQRRMAGKFVAIRLNPLRNRETLSRINIPAYPTTLLGTPNGKVIGHRIGYQPPAQLQMFLNEAPTVDMPNNAHVANTHQAAAQAAH